MFSSAHTSPFVEMYDTLLVAAIAYFILIVTLGIAVSKAQYPSSRSPRPTVSIIIAARNEEENIRPCLESVARLTYPTSLLEVVVVDDRSTDSTHSIVSEFTSRCPHMKLVVTDPEAGPLLGKTNAVTRGIESSRGEILLFTDADCLVQSHWVEEVVKYYDDPEVGIVAGFTSLKAIRWFEGIQALDWFLLFSVASGAIRLNFPVTAIGNNLSVRRKVYEEVGGYRMIPFSVTEDYALFHAITSQTSFKARFPLDENTLIESNPCRTSAELYRQKIRWFTGGRNMELKSMMIFFIAYLLNLGLVILPFYYGVVTLWGPMLLKLTADLLLLAPSLSRFKRWALIRYVFHFELYFIGYVLLFPLLVLSKKKVIWKDRLLAEHTTVQR